MNSQSAVRAALRVGRERWFVNQANSSLVFDFSVRTSLVVQGGNNAVRVEVSCTINSQGLSLLGVTQRRVTASSTEVLDRWRVDS